MSTLVKHYNSIVLFAEIRGTVAGERLRRHDERSHILHGLFGLMPTSFLCIKIHE